MIIILLATPNIEGATPFNCKRRKLCQVRLGLNFAWACGVLSLLCAIFQRFPGLGELHIEWKQIRSHEVCVLKRVYCEFRGETSLFE